MGRGSNIQPEYSPLTLDEKNREIDWIYVECKIYAVLHRYDAEYYFLILPRMPLDSSMLREELLSRSKSFFEI